MVSLRYTALLEIYDYLPRISRANILAKIPFLSSRQRKFPYFFPVWWKKMVKCRSMLKVGAKRRNFVLLVLKNLKTGKNRSNHAKTGSFLWIFFSLQLNFVPVFCESWIFSTTTPTPEPPPNPGRGRTAFSTLSSLYRRPCVNEN